MKIRIRKGKGEDLLNDRLKRRSHCMKMWNMAVGVDHVVLLEDGEVVVETIRPRCTGKEKRYISFICFSSLLYTFRFLRLIFS